METTTTSGSSQSSESASAAFLAAGAFLLLLAAGSVYFYRVLAYSVDWPNSDDFDIFLGYLLRSESTTGAAQKFLLLFAPHNEHRVLLNRVFSHLVLAANGRLDFVQLVILGNLALVCSAVLLPRLLPNSKSSADTAGAFALSALLFSYVFYEASVWATASIPNFWVFTLTLAAIVSGSGRSRSAAAAGVVLSVLAALTQANGVFSLIALSWVWWNQGRRAKALVGAVLFIVVFACIHLTTLQKLVAGSGSSGETNLFDYLLFCLCFIGGAASEHSLTLCAFFGGLLTGVLVWLAVGGTRKLNPILSAFALFLLLTAAVNALGRAPMGVELSYATPRYALVSLMCVISAALGVLLHLPSRFKPAAAALLMLFSASYLLWSWREFEPQFTLRQELLSDSRLTWQLFEDGLAHPTPEHARQVLLDSVEAGFFKPPAEDENIAIERPAEVPPGAKVVEGGIVQLEQVLSSERYLWIKGWAFNRTKEYVCKPLAIVLVGKDGERFAFRTEIQKRADVSKHHSDKRLLETGLKLLVTKDRLPDRLTPLRIGVLLAECPRPVIALSRHRIGVSKE